MDVQVIGDPGLIERLGSICRGAGLDRLASRVHALGALVGTDLAEVDAALAEVPRARTVVVDSASHLLAQAGKRLRPLCVALAARAGGGFTPAARDLAVAVELVHDATLLHDDVVDLGDLRRGAPTARMLYGNAASVFAGDWLLVEALRRVRRADVPGTLDRLLAVIEEMILAESLQLERRGRLVADRASWLAIAVGKTAALFRWALDAGARAGGLAPEQCAALDAYGLHLGVAFQVIDDLLDVAGSSSAVGKTLFADLRDGKMTWPLVIALEREPELVTALGEMLATPRDLAPATSLLESIVSAIVRAGGDIDCRRLAREHAALAIEHLSSLPTSDARAALEIVAASAVERAR
jgi:octaprenyl-diphosphate synthase